MNIVPIQDAFSSTSLASFFPGWNADWHVGLATAPRLAGPWAKRPGNPLRFDGAVENPVVTLTQERSAVWRVVMHLFSYLLFEMLFGHSQKCIFYLN